MAGGIGTRARTAAGRREIVKRYNESTGRSRRSGGSSGSSTSKRSGPARTLKSSMSGLDWLRQAAKTRMAVAKSYHARKGTSYDPLSSISSSSSSRSSKSRRRRK